MSTTIPRPFHRFLNIIGVMIGLFLVVYMTAYITDFRNSRPLTAEITNVYCKKDHKSLDVVEVLFTYQDEAGKNQSGQVDLMKMALDKRIVSDRQIKLRQNATGHFYPDTYHEIRCLVVAVIIWWGMMIWSFSRYRMKLKGVKN